MTAILFQIEKYNSLDFYNCFYLLQINWDHHHCTCVIYQFLQNCSNKSLSTIKFFFVFFILLCATNISREQNMKPILCFLGLFMLNLSITHAQDCLPHASEVCKSRTNIWTDDQALCNAIYGNYPGNKANLQKIMEEHFKQSFQFIFMVSLLVK